MKKQRIESNGIHIYTESFGNSSDPAVLLIMGAQSSMIWWEKEFCQRLGDTGQFVIRYDNRDVGRSTTYEPGHPEYTFEDMADDAIHILDAYAIEKAHIVGMSMGGMLTQMIALRHPDRVSAITLIMTSNFASHLPEIEEKVMKYFVENAAIDLSDKQAFIQFTIGKWNVLTGRKYPFDEERIARLAEEEWAHSDNAASLNNHGLIAGGESYLGRTAEISIPTQVIHGTDDPIIPYAHGVHLADVIPGASLTTLEGIGHELPREVWDTIIEVITKH
ncbi:alpha/beta fold hydrolase [Paenibacillus sp. N3/727]|uniref:alpha/beta fold hydrolase n=1 Tax=Paenibacillus sp. N3/727 TaxID=2925845 RepID=UPI001F533E00|nr:alpha/beta hydrolase [Paenibacillus sp. N3/727]UNK18284.1 alpha/beta fold hydrolase [Paenibacillus sp. N3/727]